ncbi:AcrR family transcriptional regulator [Saccharothrix tamanrassetensis]|uniref:AcrR family transcriptional regulator n=1 Tax=Saccharothrix tamanrassetensis TaxID=1051531 RepID=A0A841CES0_9PSEU|nr:TetR family transcriptional regulator [Saccharothrix tamanrassetensis]MBB5955791.1 AcrR family transcriptional regulator [Saccharothrix tamanrassetensis]
MNDGTQQGEPKRRGRRAGGEDTKAALLAAARAAFVERGYEGATVRSIAARAGVDAAMVNHWFGGKEGLFAKAVLQVPIDPNTLVERLLDGPPEEMGERMVRSFLGVWDATGGGHFAAMVRSVTAQERVAEVLREFFVQTLLRRVLATVGADRQELRATLAATQIFGMGMVRYVVRFEPLASADVETMVKAVAPNLQRYLTGDIG